ncbi:MAG TPA: MBL fold metallo-hydrolase [Streptosporangiaceae bacterium]|nr:MBL fold metallo-hydrolase [Streptosporangiaceae bacterium]
MGDQGTARRIMPAPRLQEVAEGIHVYLQPDGSWCLSNSGVLVGPRSVLLIDTASTQPRARALREAIGTLTSRPARTLVNTHHHGDHTYGNFMFPEATIVGHALARSEILEAGLQLKLIWPDVEWGDIEIVPPDVTFTDRLTLYAGELEVQLLYVGPAHTTNDVVAWIPERGVLFAGDLVFNGGTPFCMMGSIAGCLEAIGTVRGLGAGTVVSGHGGVAGPEVFDVNAAYLRWIQQTARAALAAGLSPLEAARQADLGDFAGLLDPERIVGNLHRAYAEERGGARGETLDIVPIFMEMAKYNGGAMPACYA